MADTASLVARVTTEGADAAAKQLDALSRSADGADNAINKLTPDMVKFGGSTKDIINQLKVQNAFMGKSQNEIQLYTAAIHGATEAELKEIATLQNLNATHQTAVRGMGAFRNGAQQVGFQVQDMVVQLQSGTSAFVAIGQQGSQLAGAFGPGGAILGAVIALASAVGGILYKSLTETAGSTKDLENAQKQLKDTFQQTTSGTLELADGMIQLTQVSAAAAETQLALAKANADLISQQTAKSVMEDAKSWETWRASTASAISQYDALIAKGANVNDTLKALSGTYEGNIVGVNMLAQNIEQLSEKFGVNQQQALDMVAAQSAFNKQPTAENARKISDIFTEWLNNTKNLNPELIRLSTNANNNATALEGAEKAANAAADAQKKLGNNISVTSQKIREQNDAIVKNQQIAILGDKERVKAQAAADKEAFAKRDGVTKEQIDAYNAARDTESQQDIARIEKTEKDKADREAKAGRDRLDAQAKRDETAAQRQQKQADDFLSTLQRQNQDELASIDAQEQQKLEKLQSFRENDTITQQQFEDAKTQIALDADTKRNELLEKQTEDRMKKQNSADSFIEQLRAQNEGEIAEIDRQQEIKMQKLDDFYNQGLVAESDYQKARQDIQDEADKKRLDSYEGTLSDTTSALKTALGEGSALYKAAAITQTIIETYKGATAAYASLSTIPIVGPALGVAAAAAVTAAGLANVAKIRSAREQGGQLSAGQISTIAERGQPEVIMPAGASRVRTAAQMRQIMGENGNSNAGIPQISIINQTTGRIDEVQQEQDDEGRIRLLIRETVSGDFQDSNSQIAKSRKGSRGQAGM